MPRRSIIALATITAAVALAPAAGLAQQGEAHEWGARNAPDLEPAYDAQFRAPIVVSDYEYETRVLADGLVHPWAVEALPGDQGYLVTEREGRLRHVAADGTISDPITGVPEVVNKAPDGSWPTQAGLLDVKTGPDFASDRMIYFTYSKPVGEDQSATAAARGRLSEDMTQLTGVEDIFVQSPPSETRMHYGSRIVFDGRGHAFITTGEHSSLAERDFAQQTDNTYGVVVRVGLDGSVPEDNPFVGVDGADPKIWSYGHRNVQGAAIHNEILYVLEHGPAGGDELNMPLPGRNYGWPVISYGVRYDGPAIGTGKAQMPGMEQPLYFWDPVIAPGDIAFHKGEMFGDWNGDLLAGALVAPGIVRLDMNGVLVAAEERILTDIARVRDVEVLPDGSFLLTTDYDDGQLIHVTAKQ